jgi:hypothetical protein
MAHCEKGMTDKQKTPLLFLSLIIAVLNLVAMFAPLDAVPLCMPGGFRIEFVWHHFGSIKSLDFEIIFLVGAIALLLGVILHLLRLFKLLQMFPLLVCSFLLHLLSRAIFDISSSIHYGMYLLYPNQPLMWRVWYILTAFGGIASLASLFLQGWVITALFFHARRKKEDL